MESPQGDRQSKQDDETRRHRIEALRALSHQAPLQGWTPEDPDSFQAAHQRLSDPTRERGLAALNVARLISLPVLIVCLLLFGYQFGWLSAGHDRGPVHANLPVSVTFPSQHLFCPSMAAWSPNEQFVAVLAQLNACADPQSGAKTVTSVVAILDVSGRLVRLLYPDVLALGVAVSPPRTKSSPAPPLASSQARYVRYFNISWFPNDQQVALEYEIEAINTGEQHAGLPQQGVVLLRADGSGGVALHRSPTLSGRVWDLKTGSIDGQDIGRLPLALNYEWTTGGILAAEHPPALAGNERIGNPMGGACFSIWQPGILIMSWNTGSIRFASSFMALSPDGRYLASGLGFGGIVVPDANNIGHTANTMDVLLPARDSALLAVAAKIKSSQDRAVSAWPVAWSPDGRRLATLLPDGAFDALRVTAIAPMEAEHVGVLDSRTGHDLAELDTPPLTGAPTGGISVPLLAWSPRGDFILLLDSQFGMAFIWRFPATAHQ
jgi:WD40 repeat protein